MFRWPPLYRLLTFKLKDYNSYILSVISKWNSKYYTSYFAYLVSTSVQVSHSEPLYFTVYPKAIIIVGCDWLGLVISSLQQLAGDWFRDGYFHHCLPLLHANLTATRHTFVEPCRSFLIFKFCWISAVAFLLATNMFALAIFFSHI